MRSVIHFCAVILLCGCFGSKAPQGQTNMPRKAKYFNNNGLTLVSATSYDSVSGQKGEKKIEYVFKVSIVTKEVVTFDSVWVGQIPLHLAVSRENIPVKSGEFKVPMGSTLILRAIDFTSGQLSVNSKSPVPYQGVAMLRYLLSGKSYYLVAQEVKAVVKDKK